jgi:uracil phosphoribosyltransferase
MSTASVVLDHPVVKHRLTALRRSSTDGDTFRQLVAELSALLAYEALRDLGTDDVIIDTPVASGVTAQQVTETVLLVPILRAGLGMVQAIQEIIPRTEVAHVGLRRNEETLQSEVYLNRLPADLSNRRVIICDPMLATGGSLAVVADLAAERGAIEIIALCLIASVPGLEHFNTRHPSVRLVCAGVDGELNEQGFIVPGLGDAGDRLFGPPSE